ARQERGGRRAAPQRRPDPARQHPPRRRHRPRLHGRLPRDRRGDLESLPGLHRRGMLLATLKRAPIRRLGLIGVMAATVAAVAAVAYWDADRESAAALQDFADEQATLARALGAALQVPAAAGAGRGASLGEDDVAAALRSVERARSL